MTHTFYTLCGEASWVLQIRRNNNNILAFTRSKHDNVSVVEINVIRRCSRTRGSPMTGRGWRSTSGSGTRMTSRTRGTRSVSSVTSASSTTTSWSDICGRSTTSVTSATLMESATSSTGAKFRFRCKVEKMLVFFVKEQHLVDAFVQK